MRRPPARRTDSRSERRTQARRRFRAAQTSALLPALGFATLEFAAFAFNQELQLIQQLRVMSAERLHQIRERQRRSVARSQQLPDALERRGPLQFFGCLARS